MSDQDATPDRDVVSVELVTDELREVSGLGVDYLKYAVVHRRADGEFVLAMFNTNDLAQAKVWADRHAVDLDAVVHVDATLRLASEQASGLRSLAEMIEANPSVAPWFSHTLTFAGLNVHLYNDAADTAEFARIAARHGAKVTKEVTEHFFHVIADFGGVKARTLGAREEVCERVVTGTREVTKKVKDPAALAAVPEVEVTETVEDVEWVCRPLLAGEGGA